MKINNLKAIFLYSLLAFLISCKNETTYEETTVYKKLEKDFKAELLNTSNALDKLNNAASIGEKKKMYLKARTHFKICEPILAFVDSENYGYLNQPNILKVEEEDFTDIKIKEPTGFQVIEELLFDEKVDEVELTKQVETTAIRLKFLYKNQTLQFLKKHHVLWILRDAINRIALTGITGFDSPVLENSLIESQTVYKSIQKMITLFETEFEKKELYQEWQKEINKSIIDLEKGTFQDFDRYSFIKNHTQKALEIWKETVTDWKVTFPFKQAINYETSNLFSNETFNINYFTDQKGNPVEADKVALGKLLFEDTSLSNKKDISCATCHKQELYFTDGLAKSPGTTRNSPTLFYAALQKGFFHDKRTGSLEGQIIDVVNNPNEFHLSLNDLEKRVIENDNYKEAFKKIYAKEIDNHIIRNAIASYIMSLSPFNSKFDLNMQGKENSLTKNEINGFNIFTGKAKCATCHFAPLFNGLVPTLFKESEIELIGVPKSKDTINAEIDDDLGRYGVYKTEQRKFFFKTPTVRNIEKTAPYMHNGVYTTLEEIIDFYDKGGATGLGIELEYQTLPPDKLNLTNQEKEDLIVFLKTLTDKY
ncbi:methylamine utilization protein [Flavobacterium sediminilitoris]|uniref:Methylamine utilization protein n=1 Tax=Flavobacterium sediminilitoris TaxID=2024526 RepID=A0ABY4HM84_9FLAO|nr:MULTISPECIES: cytochrome c peroxidase [Flavobacterium]UOX33783.1 methylamine utilization protein [Flavobacterium sediminilitoris]